MTIGKYEQEIAKQSRHIIGSALKPFLDKIIDLTYMNSNLKLEIWLQLLSSIRNNIYQTKDILSQFARYFLGFTEFF
jgi:hypothetical protein